VEPEELEELYLYDLDLKVVRGENGEEVYLEAFSLEIFLPEYL
jgi:hypothetical protein